MMISRLDLRAFGRFTDLSIDLSAGPRRFHLIFGPNEAGKSTTLRAITSLLFGMSATAEDCYVHQTSRVRVGGVLFDPVSGRSLECVRRRGRKGTLRDADDDQVLSESEIQGMLDGMDQSTFLSQYGLSYESLVKGGREIVEGDSDLGQILFAAGAGLGQLRDIQRSLDEASRKLFNPRASKATINSRLKDLEDLRKELKLAQVPTSSFLALRKQLNEQKREATRLGEKLFESAKRVSRLKACLEAAAILPKWRDARQSLSKLPATPRLDEAFTERRRKMATDREIATRRQQEIEERIESLQAKLESKGDADPVLQREKEIESLFQQIAARESADATRVTQQRKCEDLTRKIQAILHEIAPESGLENVDSDEAVEKALRRLHVSDADRSRIRKLVQRNETLVHRRDSASETLETTRRKLADASSSLERLGDVDSPDALSNAIDSIGKPQVELEALHSSRDKCESQRRRCEDMLRRLEGYEGDLAEVVKLPLPSDTTVRELSEKLRLAVQEVSHADLALQQQKKERDELQRALLDEQSHQELPTNAQLAEAREERDGAADRLAGRLATGEASADELASLRQRIRNADQVVDTIREHSERVHRRETMVARIRVAEERVGAAKKKLEEAQSHRHEVRSAWGDAWQSCEIEPGDPEEMFEWRSRHQQLCVLLDQLREDETRCQRIQSRIDIAARRLRTTLDSVKSSHTVPAGAPSQGGLFDSPSEDDFAELYDEAVAERAARTRQLQKREVLTRRCEELGSQLAEQEVVFETAQQELSDWKREWKSVTESFVAPDKADPGAVSNLLDRISEIGSLKSTKESHEANLRTIREDDETYSRKVRLLAEDIDHDCHASQPPVAIANAMYRRLEQERSARQARAELAEQLQNSHAEFEKAASQRRDCDVALEQLCLEAECEHPEQLPEIEQRSRESIQLQSLMRQLTTDLQRLAEDLSLEDFVDLAERQDPATLGIEIEAEESSLAELSDRNNELQQQIGATQNDLDRIDGGSHASDLVQSIQVSAGILRGDIEEYTRFRIGAVILKQAIEHYRAENQSPVLQLANGYFGRLTCGEYVELRPDYDASGRAALFGVNREGTSVPVSAMSSGTADALFLALRLASLEHQMRDGKAVPVVIDDCLIQLDDARAAAALTAFSDLSKTTQVILFTHHQHLCDLATSHLPPDGFHLHRIGT